MKVGLYNGPEGPFYQWQCLKRITPWILKVPLSKKLCFFGYVPLSTLPSMFWLCSVYMVHSLYVLVMFRLWSINIHNMFQLFSVHVLSFLLSYIHRSGYVPSMQCAVNVPSMFRSCSTYALSTFHLCSIFTFYLCSSKGHGSHH